MNGTGGGSWSETVDKASGRPYFWNKQGETSWNRPDELLSSGQLATGWTQTSTPDGKVYWFNKSDKTKTSWVPPPGWQDEGPLREEPLYVTSYPLYWH